MWTLGLKVLRVKHYAKYAYWQLNVCFSHNWASQIIFFYKVSSLNNFRSVNCVRNVVPHVGYKYFSFFP